MEKLVSTLTTFRETINEKTIEANEKKRKQELADSLLKHKELDAPSFNIYNVTKMLKGIRRNDAKLLKLYLTKSKTKCLTSKDMEEYTISRDICLENRLVKSCNCYNISENHFTPTNEFEELCK